MVQDLLDSLEKTIPNEIINIKVHRGHVLQELEDYFIANKVKNVRGMDIHIEMILPNGKPEAAEDNGGVLRDMLAEYWNSFYKERCDGNISKVPQLRPAIDAKRWTSIAVIILIGYHSEGYFPAHLSPSFMKFAMGGQEPDRNDLIQDYLRYLHETESNLINQALDDFQKVEGEDLIDFFDSHKHVTIPNENNFCKLLASLAHKELLQESAYIAEIWRDKINELDPGLPYLYQQKLEDLKPSFKKVFGSMKFEQPNNREFVSMMKRLVKEFTNSQMGRFLRFCTG